MRIVMVSLLSGIIFICSAIGAHIKTTEIDSNQFGFVVIYREWNLLAGGMPAFIYVDDDDVAVAVLRNNSKTKICLPPGTYTIRVRGRLSLRSDKMKIKIKNNESSYVRVYPNSANLFNAFFPTIYFVISAFLLEGGNLNT